MSEPLREPFLVRDADKVQRLLRTYPKSVQRLGDSLFREGRVFGIDCQLPGVAYVATVGENPACRVQLNLDATAGWTAQCTCEDSLQCAHGYAAFKALLAEHSLATVQQLSRTGTAEGRPSESKAEDDFSARVKLALGRSLKPTEIAYLAMLRSVFRRYKDSGQVPGFELHRLLLPIGERSAPFIRIFPAATTTEYEFWNALAYAAKRSQVAIPEFMEPVTNLAEVESRWARWEQDKWVRDWRTRLARFGTELPLDSTPPLTGYDFRVKVQPGRATLEWITPNFEEFQPISPAQWEQFVTDYDAGRTALGPEAKLLWNAFAQHYQATRSLELYEYDFASTLLVNRLLRYPELESRFVDAEGRVLHRPAEPLRWKVAAPDKKEGSYRLSLVTASGDPIPTPLRVIEGRPTLYLGPSALFVGPPVARPVLDLTRENLIPSFALETPEGVSLLLRLGVELPETLAKRVSRERMKVTMECALKANFEGGMREVCVIDITAFSPSGGRREVWRGDRWMVEGAAPIDPESPVDPDAPIIVDDRSLLDEIPRLVSDLPLKSDRPSGRLVVRVTQRFPQIFSDWLRKIPREIDVDLVGELASFREDAIVGRVRLDVEEASTDWFDLKVVLDIAETELTPAEIQMLFKARGAYVRLKGKGWKRLKFDLSEEEDDQLARLGLSANDLSGETQRMHLLQLADPAAKKLLPAATASKLEKRFTELQTQVAPSVPPSMTAELRPYQMAGYHFLAYLTSNHFGGVLADDMGLGKTVQTLTWLLWVREQQAQTNKATAKPSLVVCPKSVMDNWRAETEKFAPNLRVKLWRASELSQLPKRLKDADLHVLNYNQLRSIGEMLDSMRWQAVILDEGQFIKNPTSQTAQIARTLVSDERLVLTGTPIENRLTDLWSLMAFAMPGILGNRAQFGRQFDDANDPLARRRLSARVRPFLLRRTKSQVAQDLPEKMEEDIVCEMEGEQKLLYSAELKRAQQWLLSVQTQQQLAKEQFHALTSLLRLRQICCSPKLLDPQSQDLGCKVEALLEQVESLLEEGHKVLIFSQFVEMLGILRDAFREREWNHYFLSGDTENRGELVHSFQTDPAAAAFLISLKAGGFGLNLTAASYVVLFDPWWNPAVENQAIDRTHRIGQKNPVIAYRLLIRGSVEEKIRQLQRRKQHLAEDVLGEERFSQTLTLDDFRFLFAD